MKNAVIVFLSIIAFSCSPFKRTTFAYNTGSGTITHSVIVPKGYKKMNYTTDSAGNIFQSYLYRDSAAYYIGYVKDSNSFAQPLRVYENRPKIYVATGARHFKGVDEALLYWKEIHRANLRAGYLNVSRQKEPAFDSASTYIAVMPLN